MADCDGGESGVSLARTPADPTLNVRSESPDVAASGSASRLLAQPGKADIDRGRRRSEGDASVKTETVKAMTRRLHGQRPASSRASSVESAASGKNPPPSPTYFRGHRHSLTSRDHRLSLTSMHSRARSLSSCDSGPALLRVESPSITLPDGRKYRQTRKSSADIQGELYEMLRGSLVNDRAYSSDQDAAEEGDVMKSLLGDMECKPEDESTFASVLHRIKKHQIERKMQFEDFKVFKAAIQSNWFCMTINDAEVFELMRRAEVYQFKGGEDVHTLGEVGTHFYVVQGGAFVAGFQQCPARMFRPGDAFGEIALLHEIRRWTTCKCLAAGCLWGVERLPFLRVMVQIARRSFDENLKMIERVKLFYFLKDHEKRELCEQLTVQVFAPGACIVRQNDCSPNSDCVYVIKSGSLDVTIDGVQVRTIGAGDYFGERRLVYNEPRSATICASVRSMALRFSKELLQKVLGHHFYAALFLQRDVNCIEGLRCLFTVQHRYS